MDHEEDWFLFPNNPQPFDTDVKAALAKLILTDHFQMEEIKRSQNITYKITTQNLTCIARVTPEIHQDYETIQNEINYLKYLSQHNLNIAKPLCDKPESFISNETKFNAVISEFAKGEDPMKDNQWITDEKMIYHYGKWMGKYHNVSVNYPKITRPLWDEVHSKIIRRAREVLTEKDNKEILTEYNELDEWIKTLPTDKSHFGLIHGDLNISNLFVWRNKDGIAEDIQVFDWDQMQYGWFAYDIAVIWWMITYFKYIGTVSMDVEWWQSIFLKGYEEERKLSDTEKNWLPNFTRVRKIFYVTFVIKTMRDKDSTSKNKPNIPDFMDSYGKTIMDVYDKLKNK